MTIPGPRPVCVLGVGRSGTSLAARAINMLGVDLGPEEEMLEPSDVNPAGFWEQREIVELNEEILAALGGAWWRPPPRPAGWERTAEMASFASRIAELVERRFDGRGRWGFKDPRTTLTLPLWRSVVGELDHLICLRNPLEVVASAGGGLPSGADPIAIWVDYTCEALRATAGRRRMFVFYEDWSADPVRLGRDLARFVNGAGEGVDGRDSARVETLFQPRLHRHHASEVDLAENDAIPVAPRILHFLVRDLAAAEARGTGSRAQALQALAARLDGMSDLA